MTEKHCKYEIIGPEGIKNHLTEYAISVIEECGPSSFTRHNEEIVKNNSNVNLFYAVELNKIRAIRKDISPLITRYLLNLYASGYFHSSTNISNPLVPPQQTQQGYRIKTISLTLKKVYNHVDHLSDIAGNLIVPLIPISAPPIKLNLLVFQDFCSNMVVLAMDCKKSSDGNLHTFTMNVDKIMPTLHDIIHLRYDNLYK